MKIPNYKILKEIGSGGMGNVYLAEHTLVGHKVAIKSLHLNLVNNKELKERFREEAKTLAKMNHPGIVRLNDYIEQQDGIFLIMEYVDGRELSDYVKNVTGPIVEEKLVKIFIQLLKAFKYAHKMNIIHRDIKPSNVIIDKDESVKILDFGIAKILEDTKSLTKTGTQLGTVYYMSPEQVKGDKNIDQRSDIYSLGVTLFHLASGRNPYDENDTEYHILNKIVKEPLPKASSFYPGVSEKIENIIAKATSKDPKDRFQNCDEFINALQNSSKPKELKENEELNKTKVIATPTPEKLGEPKRKKKLIIGLLSILFLLILSTVFFWPSTEKLSYKIKSAFYNFNGKEYNSFIINAKSKEILHFQVLENINKVPHNELLKQLKKKNDSLSNDTLNNDSLFFIGSLHGFIPNCTTQFLINNQKLKTLSAEDSVNIETAKGNSANEKNGWFIVTNKEAYVTNSDNIIYDDSLLLLVQGGPMLINKGDILSSINKSDTFYLFAIGSFIDSNNISSLAFIQTKSRVTQEELATFMKVKLKCDNAMVFGQKENILSISNLNSKCDNINKTSCQYLCYNEVFKEANNRDTNQLAYFKPKAKPKKKKKPKAITKTNQVGNTNPNPPTNAIIPSVGPAETVEAFLKALDDGNFKKAFKLQNKFFDEDFFISTKSYGGTDAVLINEVKLTDKSSDIAYVSAKYVSFDPYNGNLEVNQEIKLKVINGEWIITAIRNITAPIKL